jgi:hypothetical protein
MSLGYFAHTFHQNGNSTLAFKMATRLNVPGMENFFIQLSAYDYMKEYSNKYEALDWLKRTVKAPDLNPISMILYKEGAFDLLWDFISEPEKGSHPSSVWLIRAAAYVTDSVKNDFYGKKLRVYFDSDPPDHYFLMGKYLMNLATKEELLDELDSYEKLCEMAFFIGIKESEKGNDALAAKWFRISVETKLTREIEYRWANDELYDEYIATLY